MLKVHAIVSTLRPQCRTFRRLLSEWAAAPLGPGRCVLEPFEDRRLLSAALLSAALPDAVSAAASASPIVSLAKVSDAAEGGATGTFRVTRDSASGDLTVYFTRKGKATWGATKDYTLGGNGMTATANSVVIPDGQDHVDITLSPVDDTLVEVPETVILTLVAKNTYTLDPVVSNRTATLTIADNEPTLTLAKGGDASETDPTATGTGSLTITRDQSTNPVTVNFKVTGTAKRGVDYAVWYDGAPLLTKINSITMDPNETTGTLTLVPIDDALAEGTETATLTLQPGKSYLLDAAAKAATLTIADNEPEVQISVVDDSAVEPLPGGSIDTGTLRISRTQNTSQDLIVKFSKGGAASFGKDYDLQLPDGTPLTAATKTVTIPAGADHIDLTVVPRGDLPAELTEKVTLTLQTSPSYSLDPVLINRAASVSIVNTTAPSYSYQPLIGFDQLAQWWQYAASGTTTIKVPDQALQTTNVDTTATVSVEAAPTIIGGQTVTMVDTSVNGQTSKVGYYTDSTGTHMLLWESITGIGDLKINLDVVIAPPDLKWGVPCTGSAPFTATWTIDNPNLATLDGTLHGTATWKTLLSTEESKTVPAGPFLAAKLTTALTFTGSGTASGFIPDVGNVNANLSLKGTSQMTVWAVPDLGIVAMDVSASEQATASIPGEGSGTVAVGMNLQELLTSYGP